MAKSDKPAAEKSTASKAAEDAVMTAVSVDPVKVFRTFYNVVRNPSVISQAINQQRWDDVLSPTKYFALCFGFLVFGGALLTGEQGPRGSFNHPLFYLLILFLVLPFVFVQYVVLSQGSPHSEGPVSGMAKIAQSYAFVLGSVFGAGGAALALMSFSGKVGGFFGFFFAIGILGFVALGGWVLATGPILITSRIFGVSPERSYWSVVLGLGGAFCGFMLLGAFGGFK